MEDYGILYAMALGSLVVVAIASNDPVELAGVEIPIQLQWFGSLLVIGFTVWKAYLDPIKAKVYRLDRELGEVRATVRQLDKRMNGLETRTLAIEQRLESFNGKLDLVLASLQRRPA